MASIDPQVAIAAELYPPASVKTIYVSMNTMFKGNSYQF